MRNRCAPAHIPIRGAVYRRVARECRHQGPEQGARTESTMSRSNLRPCVRPWTWSCAGCIKVFPSGTASGRSSCNLKSAMAGTDKRDIFDVKVWMQVPAVELPDSERMICARCSIAIGNLHLHCKACETDICMVCRRELHLTACAHSSHSPCQNPDCEGTLVMQRALPDAHQAALMKLVDTKLLSTAHAPLLDDEPQKQGVLRTALQPVRFNGEASPAAHEPERPARAGCAPRRAPRRNGAAPQPAADMAALPASCCADERRDELRRAAHEATAEELPAVLAKHASKWRRDVWAPSCAEAERLRETVPAAVADVMRLASWAHTDAVRSKPYAQNIDPLKCWILVWRSAIELLCIIGQAVSRSSNTVVAEHCAIHALPKSCKICSQGPTCS